MGENKTRKKEPLEGHGEQKLGRRFIVHFYSSPHILFTTSTCLTRDLFFYVEDEGTSEENKCRSRHF